MRVRCKLTISSAQPVGDSAVQLVAFPVTPSKDDPVAEDERFHRYTPNGKLELLIDNPSVAEAFKGSVGRCIYVELELAPLPAAAQ
jgi:hypothetical protein